MRELSGNSSPRGEDGCTRRKPLTEVRRMDSKRSSGERELVSPNGDKRLVRRDSKGRFTESDDLGRSLSQDVRKQSDTEAPRGQGDRGDRHH
jgi:hypothetical protein